MENPVLEALQLTFEELVLFLPKILFSIGILVVYVLIALIITKIVRKTVRFLKIDEIFKPFLKEIISISDLIVFFVNLGLALLAMYTLTSILLPEYLHALTSIIEYIGRIISIVFIIFFTFILLNSIVERVKMETKMKGFMLLMTLFIALILIIDVTAISEEVKASLTWGMSLGLGLVIGVFAVWYFFREHFKGG